MPEYKTPLHYRFHEEDFDTAYLPNQSNTAGTIFQGEWSSAWGTYGANHQAVSYSTEHFCEVSAYGFAPAFRFYATSSCDANARPHYSFINQYRDDGIYPATSKNANVTESDPYMVTMEFCHTTAKFTAFEVTNRANYQTNMVKDLEILGSLDGETFVSLVKYVNTNFTARSVWTVEIPADKQDWYKSYRFKCTSNGAGSGYGSFGFITPIGKWKSYRVQQIPLYTRDNDIEMVLGSGEIDQSYTTAGTYSITLASDSIVEVEIAGAGGGGSGAAQKAGDKSAGGGAGGRGGKSTHIVSVPAGTYEIIVGAGGEGTPKVDGGGSDCKSLDAPAGGDSSVFGIVEKGGGGGTHAFSRGTNTYSGSDGASYGEGGLGGAKGLAYQPSPDGDGKDGEDGWIIIKSQTNKAAPIKMDGNTVFAAYDLQTNQFASPVNCKIPNKEYSAGDNKKRVYYKDIVTDWTQPALTANGTVGGDVCACEASANSGGGGVFAAFDNKGSSTYWRSGTSTGWITLYSPDAIKVTNIQWLFFYSYPTGGTVQGSNDNSSWETLKTWTNAVEGDFNIDLSSNTKFFKYYRINITGVNKDVIHCYQLNFTAKKVVTVESDSSDYEYYKDYEDRLLLRQCSDGSYTCNTAGTITFTVPRGVRNVQCKAGSVSSWDGYTNYIKDEKGQYWAYVRDYRVSSGESYDDVSDRREYVVAVSSGKTYSLKVWLSHTTAYPTINWSAAINEMTPTVFAD